MAKYTEKGRALSNEQLEAKIEEFAAKLENLRVRYEQYFIGVEKQPPTNMRMDVARIMRELEQAFTNNTAIKFKIQSNIQKFTSYSTYWNRILREIEDGTYKRHLDKAKRQQAEEQRKEEAKKARQEARQQQKAQKDNDAPKSQQAQSVADEAQAFLASLGLAPKPAAQQPVPQAAQTTQTQPAYQQQYAQNQAAYPQQYAQNQALQPSSAQPQSNFVTQSQLRNRRPSIISNKPQTNASPTTDAVVRPSMTNADRARTFTQDHIAQSGQVSSTFRSSSTNPSPMHNPAARPNPTSVTQPHAQTAYVQNNLQKPAAAYPGTSSPQRTVAPVAPRVGTQPGTAQRPVAPVAPRVGTQPSPAQRPVAPVAPRVGTQPSPAQRPVAPVVPTAPRLGTNTPQRPGMPTAMPPHMSPNFPQKD